MAPADELTVLEHSRISPAPGAGSVNEKSIPLSFLDQCWIGFFPIHQLCFYEHPFSKSHFTHTVIPKLKHSLSITLQHFFPYAGNLIVFRGANSLTPPKKQEIRCADGDSVSLIVAESRTDFGYLTGNHARCCDKFYPLVPSLGHVYEESDYVKVPLLAVQVTLFSDRGIGIGVTTHHAACDGNARVRFLKTWASITNFGDDKAFLASRSIPFFDRSIIEEPDSLAATFWSLDENIPILRSRTLCNWGPSNKVRASFMVTRTQINRLKEAVLARRPTILLHISSFVAVCGHIWSSIAKLHATIGEEKGADAPEQITFAADTRTRLDPPIPVTYFGNCLVPCIARAKRIQLLGEEGYFNAVELIREAINTRFSSKESIFQDVETWVRDAAGPPTTIGIAGSPKFNIYDTDFGWGKPKSCEAVSIDYGRSVSLNVSKESADDLEVGLSLPKIQMDAFETIFGF